jgi:homoserine O-succinyltransferase
MRDLAAFIPALAPLRIGLLNNMQGTGFHDADRQFRALVTACGIPARVDGYTIAPPPPAIPTYRRIDPAGLDEVDALIITGAEPRAARLEEEPDYPALTRLIDRAIATGLPLLFSCLASHAAVLHLSGIPRRRLDAKCHGLFEVASRPDHPLTRTLPARITIPHSRWNTLDAEALEAQGYVILAASPEAGVDRFTHPDIPHGLFLQGHPEYGTATIALEYRRDVRRYLNFTSPTYPTLPHRIFTPDECAALNRFAAAARSTPHPDLMAAFPTSPHTDDEPPWRPAAARLYRLWLDGIATSARSGLPVHHHPSEVTSP